MSIKLGSTGYDSIYLGSTKIGTAYLGSTKVFSSTDPYNPLGLPSHTIRIKYEAGQTPSMGDAQTLVDATENIWDIYTSSNDWSTLFSREFSSRFYLLSVLGANTSGVTNMSSMFAYCSVLTSVTLFDTSSVTDMSIMFDSCSVLTSVPLFDTSGVTNMASMFGSCSGLTSVPLFDTSSATNTNGMFYICTNVQSGALALYNQCSTQTNPPASHVDMFTGCGSNTASGTAELAQIPASWGGTGA